ncbi:MAG: hypothetical protein ACD_18C00308G0001 [uncultured bacterium]|nr:MAG: hypothetical protein ACD_18C00308G0001 [uncultured bacterium]
MAKLTKYTLSYNNKKEKWGLDNDKTDKTIRLFNTKDEATKKGVLKNIVGKSGGSVKIKNKNNKYQEERTYPKSKDPKESKG